MNDGLFELDEIKKILGYINDIFIHLNDLENRMVKLEEKQDE